MKVVVAGGSGFIGQCVLESLIRAGHDAVLLSRRPETVRPLLPKQVRMHSWDAVSSDSIERVIEEADAVINLTGESIAAGRWTQKQKEKIINSRIQATQAIVAAVKKAKRKPAVLINASAIGYYGNVPEGKVTEQSPKGKGFLAEICEQWERAAASVREEGVRLVWLRIGVVLDRGGGALEKLIPPFLFFAGGPLGSGKQGFSWIHRNDIAGIVLFLLKYPEISGPVNATAPFPVTMNEFCRTLGKVLRRPSWLPAPALALKILLGEMADEMLLSGQQVIPEKLLKAGYSFQYADAEKALRSILTKKI